MASTFYQASNIYNGRYMCLSCYQTKDIATNKSKIDWVLETKGGNSNYYSTGPTTVTIAGQQVYYKGRTDWSTKSFPAAKGSVSGTIYVDHDTQGNKQIDVSFTTAIYTGTTSTYSGTWYLDNIPRKAELTSAPNFTDLENPTIYYSNPAGSAVTIQTCIAIGWDVLIPYKSLKTDKNYYTYEFTPEERTILRNAAPNGTLKVNFFVTTIIDGTYYYSLEERTLSIVENENTKPSITMSVSLNNGSLPSTFDGLYIQGKSRLGISLSGSGKYNATITKKYAVLDGKTYSTEPITTDVIQTLGNVNVVGTVEDSRRFTKSKTEVINVIPYRKPYVISIGSENAIACYRSDGNGKRVGNSTSVWIKAKRDYYKVESNGVQKNFCALQWRRKLVNDAWDDGNNEHKWHDLISKTSTTNDEYNALLPSEEVFELTKSYIVQIMATDDVGETDVKTFEIPTQDVALHLGEGGKNVAVGTYCDCSKEYTFYSEWDAYFDKDIYISGNKVDDFITEQGTDGIWTWEKWASGKAVCYGTTEKIPIQYARGWYDIPYIAYYQTVSYHFPTGLFTDSPQYVSIDSLSGSGLLGNCLNDITKDSVRWYAISHSTISQEYDVSFLIEAKGKWK